MRFAHVRRLVAAFVLVAVIGCESDKSTPNLPEKGTPPPPPGGMKNKNYDSKKSNP